MGKRCIEFKEIANITVVKNLALREFSVTWCSS